MKMIKKGDFVTRNSYNNDILFYVDEVAFTEKREKIVILKGVTVRIEADSPLDDLKLENDKRDYANEFFEEKNRLDFIDNIYNRDKQKYGRILHLDGDKRYSEKTEKYYRQRNLNYVVKHVVEHRQPVVIRELLFKHKPDIIVFTGHDGMIKRGRNYSDINNYRNSKYFVKAVKEARLVCGDDIVIFAGACQSFYEAIISAGANFASSPARILIDFVDPLIVAEKVAVTSPNRLVTMSDLEKKIRNGRKAISGIGAGGKAL